MIRPADLSVVLQGDIRTETGLAIASIRQQLPGARLILSTFACVELEHMCSLVDEVVLSVDPGPQVPFTFAGTTANNVNRQITTTAAGLARAATPFTLKLRTDCVIRDWAFLRLADATREADPNNSRLLTSSYFTRHPSGIACYTYHVSDWFMFGATEEMRRYWAAPLMSDLDATHFERHAHQPGSTLAATRFRARYTPEQHITLHYAAQLGYQVPAYLNEFTPAIRADYRAFLARHFAVASPAELGFALPKYAQVETSLYQQIDCVSFGDWLQLFAQNASDQAAAKVAGLVGYRPRRHLAQLLRALLHPRRRFISRLVLAKRRLVYVPGRTVSQLAPFSSLFTRK